jgi:predicted PurR-regulated permease PerM
MPETPRASGQVLYRAVLLAAGLLVLGLLFRALVTLMLAVLMTVIISIPLAAGADRAERRGIPRPLGALAVLLTALGVLAVILAFVIPTFVSETQHFVDQSGRIVSNIERQINDLTGAKPGQVGDKVQQFLKRYSDKPERLIDPITSIGFGLAGILGAIVIMLITAFYMAVNPKPLINGMVSLVPPARRAQAQVVMSRLRTAWVGWMGGVVVHMVLTLILIYCGLSLIGLDFAVVFAVVSAIAVVVPYFGAIASGVPPALFALTDSPGKALLVVLVYVIVHQLEGNVIIPLIMARAVKIHPAVIAVGVVVVGELFGLVGLFVAVPILSGIVILVDELWVKALDAQAREGPPTEVDPPREPVLAHGEDDLT